MLYGIVRYSLCLIVFMICFLLIKKSRIVQKGRYYVIAFIISSIMASVLYLLPIENLFITFSSPEKAFSYINSWEIQETVSGSDSDLVIASKNGTDTYRILPKTEDGWKISTGLQAKKVYHDFYMGTFISIYKHKNCDDYFITLFNIDDGEIDITDNRGSQIFCLEKTASSPFYQYYFCVQNINNGYILSLNGEDIKIIVP